MVATLRSVGTVATYAVVLVTRSGLFAGLDRIIHGLLRRRARPAEA